MAEIGEDITQTANREMHEELGLTLPFGFVSNPQTDTITFKNGDQCQCYTMLFWGMIKNDQAMANSLEATAIGWFDFDTLLDNIMPNNKRNLRRILNLGGVENFR